MEQPVSILLVEDSPLDEELTLAQLCAAGIPHVVKRVENRLDFISSLEDTCPDLILSDYSLPEFGGLAALEIAQRICPDVPFIFVSGAMGEEIAIETLTRGATDYVLKHRLNRLGPSVRRALEESRARLDKRKAEQELERKARELMRLNGDLQQFAYAASHDLQEPLRTISIFSRMIIKKYKGRIDSEADEYLGYIESAAQHMSALLEDLLQYVQVPAQERGDDEPVDLNQTLNETLFLFQVAIGEAGATITTEELPTISANPTQMSLVFQNLIGNALKYRSDESPKIHVGARRTDCEWIISVRDNGIGFDPAYADQIFGLFKRLDKEKASGTGLGLAICKRIIDVQGGRIWAESQRPGGSTFHFTIPLSREHYRHSVEEADHVQ